MKNKLTDVSEDENESQSTDKAKQQAGQDALMAMMQQAKKNNPNAQQDLETTSDKDGMQMSAEAAKKLAEAKAAKKLAEEQRAAKYLEEFEAERAKLDNDDSEKKLQRRMSAVGMKEKLDAISKQDHKKESAAKLKEKL